MTTKQTHSPQAQPASPARQRMVATPAFLYAIVLVMGAIGATLRYLLELVLPAVSTGGFPVGTLLINLVGCYVIYVIYQWFGRRVHIPHALARGLGVGLVGAFTTLSAFCTESLLMLQQGDFVLFATYVAITMVGTFLASVAGGMTCSLLAVRKLRRLKARRSANRADVYDGPSSPPDEGSAP